MKVFYDVSINVNKCFANENSKEPVAGILVLASILAEDAEEAKDIFLSKKPNIEEKYGINEKALIINKAYDDKPLRFLKDIILEISDLSYSEIDAIYDMYERFPNYDLENAIEQSMDNLLTKESLYYDFTMYCIDLIIRKMKSENIIDRKEENELYQVLASIEPDVTGIGYNSMSYYNENYYLTSEIVFDFCNIGTYEEIDSYVQKIYEQFKKEQKRGIKDE